MSKINIGFLASGSGTNAQAIIDKVISGEINARLAALVSNNSNAGALEKARSSGIATFHISEKNYPEQANEKIIEVFKECGVDIIVLAGYMKMLDGRVIEAFGGRVTNIHPALLPKFGGKGMFGINVHKAVIEAGETISGATVHLVNAEYDKGRILAQKQVPVMPDDSSETLSARVLLAEHIIYADTLRKIADGEIQIP